MSQQRSERSPGRRFVLILGAIVTATFGVSTEAVKWRLLFGRSTEVLPAPTPPPLPVRLVPNAHVASMALARSTSCALMSDGSIWCWGYIPSFDEAAPRALQRDSLAGNAGVDRRAVRVADAAANRELAMGEFALCTLDASHVARCTRPFGANIPGKRYVELSNVSTIRIGPRHACAITKSDGLKCWGANEANQIGRGAGTFAEEPTSAPPQLRTPDTLALGSSFTCALHRHSPVRCWGDNSFGQLGGASDADGITTVASTEAAIEIVAGDSHACALLANRHMRCWGANTAGQLGDGTWQSRPTPVEVAGIDAPIERIAASGTSTCALTAKGKIYCWGDVVHCEMAGCAVHHETKPKKIVSDVEAVELAMAADHACIRSAGGAVWCWGDNHIGQVSASLELVGDQLPAVYDPPTTLERDPNPGCQPYEPPVHTAKPKREQTWTDRPVAVVQ